MLENHQPLFFMGSFPRVSDSGHLQSIEMTSLTCFVVARPCIAQNKFNKIELSFVQWIKPFKAPYMN